MRRVFFILALALGVIAMAWWAAAGANRGWTKTSVERVTLDEVTGIEGRTNENRFVPGVEYLGLGLLLAGVLAGVACFLPKRPAPVSPK